MKDNKITRKKRKQQERNDLAEARLRLLGWEPYYLPTVLGIHASLSFAYTKYGRQMLYRNSRHPYGANNHYSLTSALSWAHLYKRVVVNRNQVDWWMTS